MKKLVGILFVGAFGLLITDFGEVYAVNARSGSYVQKNRKKNKIKTTSNKQKKKAEKARKKAEKKERERIGNNETSNDRYENRQNMIEDRWNDEEDLSYSNPDDDSYYYGNSNTRPQQSNRIGNRNQRNKSEYYDSDADSYYSNEGFGRSNSANRRNSLMRSRQNQNYDEENEYTNASGINALRNAKRKKNNNQNTYGKENSERKNRRNVCICPGCGGESWKDEFPEDYEERDAGSGRNLRNRNNFENNNSNSRNNNRNTRQQNRRTSRFYSEKSEENAKAVKAMPVFTKSDVPNFDLRKRKLKRGYQVQDLKSNQCDVLKEELQEYRAYFSKKA